MTEHHYRISVIPAGAVIDPRLKAQDIRVLALLGRHTNKHGWCRRRQTEMAKELGCSRGTVQSSLTRLVDAQWVEVRLEGRQGVGPNPDKQPFAAHSYRVSLDGERIPPDMPEVHSDEVDTPDVGEVPNPLAPPPAPELARGASPELARGASPGVAPLEEVSLNQCTKPDQREVARAREAKRRFTRDFRKRWPTTGVDDQAKLDKAMDDLPEDQHQLCLDGIDLFLAELKKHGRGHPPAGWKYIGERKWTLLPPRAEPAAKGGIAVKCWGREWYGALLMKIASGSPTGFMVQYALDPGKRETSVRANELPSTEALAAMISVPSDGHVMQAWRPWFERHGVRLPQWRERVWVWLPSVDPPEGSNAWAVTSPPTQAEAMNSETTGAT